MINFTDENEVLKTHSISPDNQKEKMNCFTTYKLPVTNISQLI